MFKCSSCFNKQTKITRYEIYMKLSEQYFLQGRPFRKNCLLKNQNMFVTEDTNVF